MSDRNATQRSERAGGAAAAPADFEEGRYLYCVVDSSGADEPAEFSTEGLDDERTYLVGDGGIGVVVHDCESVYDPDDPDRVRRLLLAHQRVVDDAGDAFGTPIPFRFHTILPGGDDAVREWIDDVRPTLESDLADLAGHWEYRISLRLDDEHLESRLTATDEELRELRAQTDSGGTGTSFLREKQYEQQLRKRKRERRQQLLEELREAIAPHVREADVLGRRRATLEGVETADEPIQRVATLVHEDDVDALGAALDDVAAMPGVEIRFTGPWPPYTFAPDLSLDGDEDGAVDGTDSGGGDSTASGDRRADPERR